MSALRRKQATLMGGVLAVILASVLAGCRDHQEEIVWPEDPPPSRSADSEPTATPDPAVEEAASDIVALVLDFRQAEVASYTDPKPPHLARRELGSYLADPLLSQTVETLHGLQQAGVVFEGRPNWAPTVTEVRLNDVPPTATVRDCVDATNWQSVFRETGDPVPGDALPDRYVARLELTLYDDGWRLHDIAVEEDSEC